MWLYLFKIKNHIEKIFFIAKDSYLCVYKNKAPKN